jgi:hypothetical protein
VAKQGRNARCRCGSGRKAKHCCDSPSGPPREVLERAFLARAASEGRWALAAVDEEDLEALLDELPLLVRRFPELAVQLPALVDPALERLLVACETGVRRTGEVALADVARRFDTAAERARLARDVLRLREEGRLSDTLAAVALLDLADEDAIPLLVLGAVLEAARVRARLTPTPAGLLVAS